MSAAPIGPFGFLMPSKTFAVSSSGHTPTSAAPPLQDNFRNQTATATSPYTIGSLCRITWAEISLDKMLRNNHELSPQLYLYLFVILEENSKQNCFACLLLPILLEYVDITKLKERNMSTSTGPQLAFFPLSAPVAASKTPYSQKFSSIHNKTVGKNASILLSMIYRYCSNAPLWGPGWLWAHAILCNQFVKTLSRLTRTNKRHFMISMSASSSFNAVIGLASSASLSNAMAKLAQEAQ